MRHRYICQKKPAYQRYVLIDTSIKDNLQQSGSTIHQYPACSKAGYGVIRQSFKQQIKMISKLENTICTTPGNKSTLLDVANGKALGRMSQISQIFLSTKILVLQLCLRPSSPFHVGKILIYAMPNAGYHKIDLRATETKHNKSFLSQKSNYLNKP